MQHTSKTNLAAIQPIPKQYNNVGDSTNISDLSKQLFYQDEVLLQLIDTALKYNPDIQIALQRVLTAEANLQISKGLTKPSVDAVLSTGVDKFGDYTMNGLGNYDMNLSPNINKDQRIPRNMPDFYLGLRSSWEADIWGKLATRKKAAYLRYLSSEKGKQLVITQLVASVATLYYELKALVKEEEIILNNIKLQENALDIVKAQKQGGRATELAVQQFNAQLLGTKSFLYVIKQLISETRYSLNAVTGKMDQSISNSKSITEMEIPLQIKAGVPSQLLTNRWDIQEAELQLKAAGADVETSRKAFLPSLNITAYTALNTFNPSFWITPQSIAYGMIGSLVAPILSKNVLRNNFTIASIAEKEAFFQYQKNINQAYKEVQTHLKAIEYYKLIYALKIQETNSLQAAVSTSKELYLTGYASYLEVIAAQRGVLDAELESVKSKKTILLNLVNLYRSLGGGWK